MRDGKRREENKGENDIFPCLVQERKHKGWKILGKKIQLGSQIFFLRIWEENWEEKREKRSSALELHIYPLPFFEEQPPFQVDVLYVSFFPFLFYFIMGTCVIVS